MPRSTVDQWPRQPPRVVSVAVRISSVRRSSTLIPTHWTRQDGCLQRIQNGDMPTTRSYASERAPILAETGARRPTSRSREVGKIGHAMVPIIEPAAVQPVVDTSRLQSPMLVPEQHPDRSQCLRRPQWERIKSLPERLPRSPGRPSTGRVLEGMTQPCGTLLRPTRNSLHSSGRQAEGADTRRDP